MERIARDVTSKAAERAQGEAREIVLFHINDRYFSDFALGLQRRGMRIHTIVSSYPERLLCLPQLSTVNVLDTRQFQYPKRILSLNEDDPDCLSAELIKRFVPVENLFLSMTDRMSYRPATVRFRVRLFRALLQYWQRFFTQATQVATTFHISAPHMAWDLIAFHVAKELGLRTLFLERSLIENRVLLLDDYVGFDKVPRALLAELPSTNLASTIDAKLLAAVNRPSPWSKHSANINQAILGKDGSAFERFSKRARLVLSASLPSKLARVTRRFFGESRSSALLLSGPVPTYQMQAHIVSYRRWLRRLRKLYDALAKPVGDGPYVFFALHLQPERSTCPQGDVYDDQLLAIETTAKALPEGFRLYVKEHPRQFWPTFLKARHYRDADFYRRVNAMPRVQLVPLAAKTEPLIAEALATATITGSAGWESLLAGKPCLAFGTPWYVSCNSCHAIRSLADCRRAIAACQNATAASVQRDLLAFLAFMQDRFIYASNGTRFAKDAADYDILVDNLAASVVESANNELPILAHGPISSANGGRTETS